MNHVDFKAEWPESWQRSFAYDEMELYGNRRNPGYSYAYQERAEATFRLLDGVCAPGARILDIAAAQGNFTLRLAEKGYAVTWNDLRAELADYVRLKHEFGSVTYRPGNAFDLSFDSLFDAVLITEVIEHVAHPDDFLAKTAQLVKPGGYVIMTTPNGAYFRNPLPKFSETADPSVYEAEQFKPDADGHIFLLHQEELPRLAQAAGLEVRKVALMTNPLLKGALGLRYLLPLLPRTMVVNSLCKWQPSSKNRLPANIEFRGTFH